MRFESHKFVVEYSFEQESFHVQSLAFRLGAPRNGYHLIGIFNSYGEAFDQADLLSKYESEIILK